MALFYSGEGTYYRAGDSHDSVIGEYGIPDDACVHRFTSVRLLRTKCLSAAESGAPYVVFSGVGLDDLEAIDRYREREQGSTRVLYDEEAEVLIVKLLPGLVHEHAIGSFSREMVIRSLAQGLTGYEFELMGGSRYGDGGGRRKEADAAYKPSTRLGGGQWPSFVVEVGVSQTLSQLRCDMHFWLTKSHGMVRVVLLIKVNITNRSIIMEHWEDVPRVPPQLATETTLPLRINRIELSLARCVGDPLCISWAKIFDVMPPNLAAGASLVLTGVDLTGFYARFWECVG
jgi:hypothetical protein